MTYNQLLNHALAMLDEQGPDAAFKLMIQEALQTDKVNQAQIYNFAYCFAALAGKTKEAMNLLQEAVCKEGFWYSYEYLMEDEDLEELRKDPAFERIANICRQRQEEAQSAAEPVLAADDLQPGMPVLLALHGDLRNINSHGALLAGSKGKGLLPGLSPVGRAAVLQRLQLGRRAAGGAAPGGELEDPAGTWSQTGNQHPGGL